MIEKLMILYGLINCCIVQKSLKDTSHEEFIRLLVSGNAIGSMIIGFFIVIGWL